jgi:hypothetical protein
MKTHLITTFLIFTILTACGQVPIFTPTATVIPTNTPAPMATATMQPTATLVPPTPTIEPPAQATEFLSDVAVLSYDPVDNLNNWNLWDASTGSITNGVLELQGKSFWATGLVFNRKLDEGEGVILTFKLKKASGQSEFVFDTGDWQTDSFRQFGIYNGTRPEADLFQGKNDLGGNNLVGNLSLKTNTWYNLLMAIGKNGELFGVMSDPASEGHVTVYHETIGAKWAGEDWDFTVKANEGETVNVKNFYSISFGEIKK